MTISAEVVMQDIFINVETISQQIEQLRQGLSACDSIITITAGTEIF